MYWQLLLNVLHETHPYCEREREREGGRERERERDGEGGRERGRWRGREREVINHSSYTGQHMKIISF